jgi:hypothetical protein
VQIFDYLLQVQVQIQPIIKLWQQD